MKRVFELRGKVDEKNDVDDVDGINKKKNKRFFLISIAIRLSILKPK